VLEGSAPSYVAISLKVKPAARRLAVGGAFGIATLVELNA
jgi:hypothetical protein